MCLPPALISVTGDNTIESLAGFTFHRSISLVGAAGCQRGRTAYNKMPDWEKAIELQRPGF
jgi:hypothetical protein